MGRDGELKPHPAPDQIAANREKRSAGSSRRRALRASLASLKSGRSQRAWDRFFGDFSAWLDTRPGHLRWLSPQDAEDTVQEVMTTVMEIANESPGKLSVGYLATVVRTKSVDSSRRLRRIRERESTEEGAGVAVAEPEAKPELQDFDRSDAWDQAEERLTPKQQKVVRLLRVGCTYREIAELTGSNAAAIRNLAVRAREVLRNAPELEDLL